MTDEQATMLDAELQVNRYYLSILVVMDEAIKAKIKFNKTSLLKFNPELDYKNLKDVIDTLFDYLEMRLSEMAIPGGDIHEFNWLVIEQCADNY